jgi:23S rRNA pseudouridine955/2504/2580 synthase
MAAIGHPIVGDGKYGGQAAFLSGSISRKLHLHARRLLIPHPEGDTIDVSRAAARTFRGQPCATGIYQNPKATCRSNSRR